MMSTSNMIRIGSIREIHKILKPWQPELTTTINWNCNPANKVTLGLRGELGATEVSVPAPFICQRAGLGTSKLLAIEKGVRHTEQGQAKFAFSDGRFMGIW